LSYLLSCPKPPDAASMAVKRRRTGRLHPKDRSVSGGRRQPSLLLREECGVAAGEEGRRSRCRPRPARRQTRRDERPYRGFWHRQQRRRWRSAPLQRVSALAARQPSRCPPSVTATVPSDPTKRTVPDTAQTMLISGSDYAARAPVAGLASKSSICSTHRTSPA